MLSALAAAAPDHVPAPNSGHLLVMAFGGQRKNGESFVTGDLLAGGSGAGRGFDGIDAIESDVTNCMNLPAEAMELEAPIRVNRWSLKTDSGGPGTWRGGLGQIKEFEVLDDVEGSISFSHRGERHFFTGGRRERRRTWRFGAFVDCPQRRNHGDDSIQGGHASGSR